MSTGTTHRVGSLLLLAVAFALVAVGPDWPGQATALICGESVERMSEQRTLPNMDACVVVMSRAADAVTRCFCSVKENRFAPAYYLAFVPIMFLAALWVMSRAAARGMAAFVIVLATTLMLPGPIVSRMYGAGMRIPTFLAIMAIGWPQFLLFGPTMFRAGPATGLVLPPQWALIITMAFWLLVACAFGFIVRRVKSFPVLFASAVILIIAAALAVRLVVPVFHWQMMMESP